MVTNSQPQPPHSTRVIPLSPCSAITAGPGTTVWDTVDCGQQPLRLALVAMPQHSPIRPAQLGTRDVAAVMSWPHAAQGALSPEMPLLQSTECDIHRVFMGVTVDVAYDTSHPLVCIHGMCPPSSGEVLGSTFPTKQPRKCFFPSGGFELTWGHCSDWDRGVTPGPSGVNPPGVGTAQEAPSSSHPLWVQAPCPHPHQTPPGNLGCQMGIPHFGPRDEETCFKAPPNHDIHPK